MSERKAVTEFDKGNQLLQEGKLEDAITFYCRAIESDPTNSRFHHTLGEALAKLKRWDEATTAFGRAIELEPDFSWSYHHLGDTLAHQERWQEAADAFRKGIQLNPDHFGTYVGLGNVLVKLQLLDEAIVAYRHASKLNPDTTWVHYALASTLRLRTQSDLAEAIASYRHMIELNPDDLEAYHSFLQVQPDNWEVWLQWAQALVRQNKMEDAIEAYRQAVALNPSSAAVYYELAEILVRQEEWKDAKVACQQAVELDPDLAEAYYLLGAAQVNLNCQEEAIAAYRYAGELFVKHGKIEAATSAYQEVMKQIPSGLDSFNLGMLLLEQNRVEEGLSSYQKALEIQPDRADDYLTLAIGLIQKGLVKEVIGCYHQVFNQDPIYISAYHRLGRILAEKGLLEEGVACFQEIPQRQPNLNEICDYLWKGLNQLGPLDETSLYCQTEIQWDATNTHLREKSQYTVMTVDSLSDADKEFLEKSGFSIAHLGLIAADDIYLEEIYVNSFNPSPSVQLAKEFERRPWKELSHPDVMQTLNFQQSMVETGYVYSICPVTGKILRSNQSFTYGDTTFIYRFVGVHVFYLIITGWGGGKRSIYLPHLELILNFRKHDWWVEQQCTNIVNTLKSCAIGCWQQFKSYIANTLTREVVAMSGLVSNIGHFFWNEMSGLQNLYNNGVLDKIDRFLVSSYEYFSVAHLFPEIPKEKFTYNYETGLDLFKTVLSQNYFILRFTDLVVTEELANRVIQAAHTRCSPAFLQEVEQAKQHFPLLWVCFRQRSRAWISQVEGTANIIKKLHSEFPNLGVVFGGWSPKEDEQATPWEASFLEAPIKTYVEQVLALLPAHIKTYNAFGRPNYENIILCNAIDLYLAPMGSETGYVTLIVNKPGVLHTNTGWNWDTIKPLYVEARENCIPPVLIAQEYIIEQDNSNHMTRSYDCDWQVMYDELIQIIHNLIISNAQGQRR